MNRQRREPESGEVLYFLDFREVRLQKSELGVRNAPSGSGDALKPILKCCHKEINKGRYKHNN